MLSTSAQVCNIDSTNFAAGKYIYPDSLPCINQQAVYSGTVSLMIPDSLDAHLFESFLPANTYYVHLDSVRIDSVTGMPTGITAGTNPVLGKWIHGGQYACALFSGTTNATTGSYPISIYGKGCIHGTILGFAIDSCQSGNLGAYLNYNLNVCTPGTGISELSNNLALNIYPNPNQGTFTVTISSATHINGTMSVLDELGRTIQIQSLDVTGTKQIPLELKDLASGSYLLVVNTNNGRSVKQFIVK
jgi:hypothetical protein